ncbi:MAG: hypothetical protein JOZ02_01475 [Acidobacteria bacterium]|nr:hypothetical protein [Acidobacteriota bacterium]
MRVMEALTGLVVGVSRFGDHLLSRKVSGVIVAALAFGCGAGLASALKREPRTACVAFAEVKPADPARAEVSISDTPGDEGEGKDAVFEGAYRNFPYGYSVEIPAGMVGLGSTPPAPQHGFGIDLDNPRSPRWPQEAEFPKSYVYVDGSYNSLEWEGLGDAVNFGLRCLRKEGKNVRVRSRTKTSLGGLRAVRVVALYEQGGEAMVSDEVVSIDDETGVVFTLGLSTPLPKYERDRPALEALRKSWCLQPVE